MFRIPFLKERKYMEDDHVVKTFRRLLPADEKRKHPIIQFFSVDGGLRTVDTADIIDVA